MYTITELYRDPANKYRVRVIINNDTGETLFFKFDHYPTQQEVDDTATNYLLSISNNITATE